MEEDTKWSNTDGKGLTTIGTEVKNHTHELHFPSTRMALSKAQKITGMGEDVKKWQSLYTGPGDVKETPTLQQFDHFSKRYR